RWPPRRCCEASRERAAGGRSAAAGAPRAGRRARPPGPAQAAPARRPAPRLAAHRPGCRRHAGRLRIPVGYGVWLSLQRYDLRFPAQRGFVGLANYAAVLSAPVFWSDLAATAVITVL